MPRLFHNGSPRVTCSHPCHLARGTSAGGEDFGLNERTPLFAPVSGTYRFRRAGTGGWTITVIPADARLRGFVLEVMHLHSSAGLVLGGASRYYSEGALVGFSGGRVGHPGAGSSTGPHAHEHGYVAGRRYGIRETIARAIALVRPTAPPTNRRHNVTTLYHRQGSSPALYALAGDSPGTPANWLETTDYNGVAVPWARTHGSAITLSAASFDSFEKQYRAPLQIAGGTTTPTPTPETPTTYKIVGQITPEA